MLVPYIYVLSLYIHIEQPMKTLNIFLLINSSSPLNQNSQVVQHFPIVIVFCQVCLSLTFSEQDQTEKCK